MRFSEYLAAEWTPAMGCTEPAAIAWAASLAAAQGTGPVRRVDLRCDARTYKNCYAVGLPNAGERTGILWALAIGAHLVDHHLGLSIFRETSQKDLDAAAALLEAGGAGVEVDRQRESFLVDCTVVRASGTGRAVLEHEHTRLQRLETNGNLTGGAAAGEDGPGQGISPRVELSALGIEEVVGMARSLLPEDRLALRRGAAMNIAIAHFGCGLLPPSFVDPSDLDPVTRLSRLVAAGVHARMSGTAMPVMTLAGSGNKGITVSVPLALRGEGAELPPERVDEALALACLLTSATTHHLGTLSAMCGGAVAAGIGLAGGIVLLEGGAADTISLAVNTMVGNLTGIICDGAKIGCGMKTMTGVDAAFRAASLARAGVGIPVSDGIVGSDGLQSLHNLGRIATRGMDRVDDEILDIMESKLRA